LNSQQYFDVGLGKVPIVLSCPHGGYKKPKNIPDRLNGVQIPDKNTYVLAKRIIQVLKEKNINIFYILSKIHRKKVDLNRPPRSFVAFEQSSNEAREIHQYYHMKIQDLAQKCLDIYNKCLFIDLHGFTKPHGDYPDIILGNIFGNSLVIKQKDEEFWGFSSILTELIKEFKVDDGLGFSDYNLAYSGGYITYQFYKRENINAFQIEVAKTIRQNLSLTKNFIKNLTNGIENSL